MTRNSCCGKAEEKIEKGLNKIAILGSPNVGKSVLFNRLTGAYVTVSNYPGTAVEVSRGKTEIGEKEYEVIDTPSPHCKTSHELISREVFLFIPAAQDSKRGRADE